METTHKSSLNIAFPLRSTGLLIKPDNSEAEAKADASACEVENEVKAEVKALLKPKVHYAIWSETC